MYTISLLPPLDAAGNFSTTFFVKFKLTVAAMLAVSIAVLSKKGTTIIYKQSVKSIAHKRQYIAYLLRVLM